jgi:DNA polymerase
LALVAHRKFEAALRGASPDGRLRGQFVYCGAHTARWSSRGVQVHNLAKLAFTDPEGDYDEIAEDLAIEALRLGLGVDPVTLKMLVRPMFLGPLATSDFSAIEARVLAWMSGEQWVLEAFIALRDLYVETAKRMGGGMGRPEGKIAVLAAGYQGSVNSFRNMGYGGRRCGRDTYRAPKKEDDEARAARLSRAEASHVDELLRDPNHKDDSEIRAVVDAWREANPSTRQFWYDLERKFWAGGAVGTGKIQVEVQGSTRRIHLPSGRVMKYYGVRKVRVKTEDPETGEVRVKNQLAYRHTKGYLEKTYGGRLTENVTQAVARDLLADALLRLDAAGIPVVGHVHDEAIADYPDGADFLDKMQDIMRTPPAWAEGLPMDASAAVLARYRKD